MLRQAVVAAGGKGTRLGALARKYGNKSLVRIEGLPILAYTIEWLKEVGVQEIIVAVNHMAEYRKIEILLRESPQVAMAYNRRRTSSAQCIPPLQRKLDTRFLFVYGHAPAPPDHLHNLASIATKGVAVSLYPTTTQGATRKPAHLLGNLVRIEAGGSLFVEPPHVLDHAFVDVLAKTGSWGTSFRTYRGPLVGVRASHPSEFHYRENFLAFRKFMVEFIRKKR